MRDSDFELKTASEELRDIHHRIDVLKNDSEKQFNTLVERLHSVEVTLARGTRFPAAAWVAAIGLAVTVIGTGSVLYSQLQITQQVSIEARNEIRNHIRDMGPAENMVWKMDERLKATEETLRTRLVGNTAEGWHRRDHELYAEGIDQRFKKLEILLEKHK